MEILLSKSPAVGSLRKKSITDFYDNCVDNADSLNIATGYITNDSIAELNHILSFKENFKIQLLIGMHYIERFTELQYNSLRRLNDLLLERECGNIYLSTNQLYHGKMYSFMKNGISVGGFIGSSNLGSFVGTSNDLIEADIALYGDEALQLNQSILGIIDCIGTNFTDIPVITNFNEPEVKIFTDTPHVTPLSQESLNNYSSHRSGDIIRIPLKTEPKSNLNTYFGAGKIKGKYSRRNWYEVEIISQTFENRDILPWVREPNKNPHCHIDVITYDGYQFECSWQGTCGKNLRSSYDLAILGRWIKGHMENKGALTIGSPVTPAVLDSFGYHYICLQKTTDNKWYMWFE